MAVGIAACAGATPSGFSKGDHWTFPLVGPLEDGLLLTPVTVRGHGPYLFAIDPDANITAIDKQVADEAGLETGQGPVRIDEDGSEQSRGYAELVQLQVGTLAIERRQVMLVPATFFNVEGRQVNGVLGRDVIADGLVFGFDRDQGIGMLSTAKVFAAPPDAIAMPYRLVQPTPEALAMAGNQPALQSSNNDDASRVSVMTRSGGPTLDVAPLPRRVVAAQVGDGKFTMHLDLGAPVSQLRETLWPRTKIAATNVRIRLVDEVATVREVTEGVVAAASAGAAKSARVTLVPFVDKRFALTSVDGALGLDFFQPYAVYASWATSTFYLKQRGDAAASTTARLGRWGAALPSCPHPGCVTATLSDTGGGTLLEVVRDPEAAHRALELRLGVTPAPGKSAPPLVIELPAEVEKLSGGVADVYAGAKLTVLDVSPFTRPCDGNAGCAFQFTSARAE